MLRSPGFCAKASKHLTTQWFAHASLEANGSLPLHGLMFNIIQSYYDRFKTPPDQAILFAEAKLTLGRHTQQGAVVNAMLNEINGFFQNVMPCITDSSLPQADEIMRYIRDVCFFQEEQHRLLSTALDTKSIEGLPAKLRELDASRQSAEDGTMVSNLGSMVLPETGERFMTGIKFIDDYLGEGKGPTGACAVGIFAPQGAGKTTLGIQKTVSQALLGNHALLVLKEEGLSASVLRKIRSAATGLSMKVQTDAKDNLEEACRVAGIDLATTKTRIELLDRYLHTLDLVRNEGGMEAIENAIERLGSEGMLPRVVYIDWAGPLAKYTMSNPPAGLTFEKEYNALHYLANECAVLASRYNIMVCISHQMAPEAVKKGPAAINDHYCAADCRGFSNPFKYVWVINKKDPLSGLQLAILAKARDDKAGQLIILRHMGGVALFEEAVGFTLRGKKFVSDRAASRDHALPSESTGKRNTTTTE